MEVIGKQTSLFKVSEKEKLIKRLTVEEVQFKTGFDGTISIDDKDNGFIGFMVPNGERYEFVYNSLVGRTVAKTIGLVFDPDKKNYTWLELQDMFSDHADNIKSIVKGTRMVIEDVKSVGFDGCDIYIVKVESPYDYPDDNYKSFNADQRLVEDNLFQAFPNDGGNPKPSIIWFFGSAWILITGYH